jgi:hypothetical protein
LLRSSRRRGPQTLQRVPAKELAHAVPPSSATPSTPFLEFLQKTTINHYFTYSTHVEHHTPKKWHVSCASTWAPPDDPAPWGGAANSLIPWSGPLPLSPRRKRPGGQKTTLVLLSAATCGVVRRSPSVVGAEGGSVGGWFGREEVCGVRGGAWQAGRLPYRANNQLKSEHCVGGSWMPEATLLASAPGCNPQSDLPEVSVATLLQPSG